MMAIDYKTTSDLMHDTDFDGRVRVACLHYASYISGEDASVPAHNTRRRWAQDAFKNPDVAAVTVMPILVMDNKVQAAGAAITDVDLQSAVETSVNMMF